MVKQNRQKDRSLQNDRPEQNHLFEGKEVFVIGRSGGALQKAIELSDLARKVIVVYKEDELDADEDTIKKAKNHPKIDFMPHTVVGEMNCGEFAEEIVLANRKTKKITFHKADPKDKQMGVLVYEEEMW